MQRTKCAGACEIQGAKPAATYPSSFASSAMRFRMLSSVTMTTRWPCEKPPLGVAVEDAASRVVAVRLAYSAEHRKPIPVPPPPECAPEDIERLRVPTRAIAGIPDLMHHKFAIRDRASIWTGSTNWTDDSWS